MSPWKVFWRRWQRVESDRSGELAKEDVIQVTGWPVLSRK
jgi:hypothetical protein